MVSDEIVVVTRSAKANSPAVEWRGQADGTYSVRVLDANLNPGTQVYLTCRSGREELFRAETLKELALHYGVLLPYPIRVTSGRISTIVNEDGVPWRREYPSDKARTQALLRFGKQAFGISFMDAIPLRSQVGKVDGVAFVLPHAANLNAPPGPSRLPSQHAAQRGGRQPAAGLGVLREGDRQRRRPSADRLA